MLFSFCFTFNLLIIKKKRKKCAEDSVAVLGHHTLAIADPELEVIVGGAGRGMKGRYSG